MMELEDEQFVAAGREVSARRLPVELLLEESLGRNWRKYRKAYKECRCDFTEDAVHELRVQTRRMLSLLDLLRSLLAQKRIRKLRKVFKAHLDDFDDLRDVHVQLLLLEEMKAALPGADIVRACLTREERRLLRKTRATILKHKPGKLARRVKKLRRFLKSGKATEFLAETDVLEALRDAYGEVLRLRRSVEPADTATIHRMRVGLKKYRYMLESLRELLPLLPSGKIRQMQAYQTRMGLIQDIEVLMGAVRKRKKEFPSRVIKAFMPALEGLRAERVEDFMQVIEEVETFWNERWRGEFGV